MENSTTTHHTKPHVVVSVVGMIPVTDRAPSVVGVVVPGTAASCVSPRISWQIAKCIARNAATVLSGKHYIGRLLEAHWVLVIGLSLFLVRIVTRLWCVLPTSAVGLRCAWAVVIIFWVVDLRI